MGCGASKETGTDPPVEKPPAEEPETEEKDSSVVEEEEPQVESSPAAPVDEEAPQTEAKVSVSADTIVVFVLGGPGSGKGTQCERLVRDYGFTHLSAGDLLREEVASGSETGKMCDAMIKEGKLVPFEVTIGLLEKKMVASGQKTFLIDGFPRKMDQAEAFESSIIKCKMVLFFDCTLETMEQRLLKRGETSGRTDDNIETIKKRFKTFLEDSVPVADYYEKEGKLAKISAVVTPDEVYETVQKSLAAKLPEVAPISG